VTPRTSLLRRLVWGSLAVAVTGLVAFIVAASVATPILFTSHLEQAGETDPAVQAHAREALLTAFLAAGVLAVAVAVAVAAVVAVVNARHVARPLEILSAATARIDTDGIQDVDNSDFTIEMESLHVTLVEMSTRLARASLVRNQLLADLSHELRTPLATLEAQVDGLEDHMVQAGPETFEAMRDELSRLRRLASDVRTAAAAQEHALDLCLEPQDLRRIVDSAVAAARARFLAKNVTLSRIQTDAALLVLCDSERLQQVLANLLDNALRHTPEGGTVTVRTALDQQHGIVTVADDGEGISPDRLERIFERFYRVDTARGTFDGAGSGLGLTIALAIVRDHGGDLSATSAGRGLGAAFTLSLPLDRRAT
jgi:signal transduction histidine kinase